MSDLEREAAIGRAAERLVELALADDALRPGLEALARGIVEALDRQSVAADLVLEVAQAIAPLPDGEGLGIIAVAEAAEVPHAEAETAAEPEGDEAPAEEPPVRRRAERESVPMDRSTFLSLVEGAMREIQATERGSMVEALFGGAGAEAIAALEQPPGRIDEPGDPDAGLPGIVTRARLRAAVARDVAERARTGRPLDDGHVHRARSEGAAVWMTDLLHPDPDAVTTFAECLDALADCCEVIVLLRRYEPGDRYRRAEAVKDLAAVQSALRIATAALRTLPDDEQAAAFAWLNGVTKTERIFVQRHMRLEDPLDPVHLAEVMEPVHRGLAGLKERADRDAALRKRYQQLNYLVRQLREGKASARDADKLVETIDLLVMGGLPPSSLKLREVLEPVAARLPKPEGRSAAYGRVIAELDAHLVRVARAQAEAAQAARDESGAPDDAIDAIDSPSDAVRVARAHLCHVVIPDSATEHIDEIDHTPSHTAWGRATWRALRALEAYAHAGNGHGGFWEWCENSGHPFAWPATTRNLAMYESESVLNEYRGDRVFKVDTAVDPSGEIEMLAHCKIAESGGRLTPRLYFHDDVHGTTGRIHVGFIGGHAHVRTTNIG
jgi:hypothetical protein